MTMPHGEVRSPLDPDEFRATFSAVEHEIARVIVGQAEMVRQVLVAMVCGGHALVEGVPGLGKTLLMRTLAEVIDGVFSRIQATPDLMPADIVGTTILQAEPDGARSFRFEPGPVFANLVLADEINRATPKTQSALLEAMQERTVTVGKRSYRLPAPFFVLATQNPIEMEGTFPLPEAQLDRFLLKIDVPFPSTGELIEIAGRTTGSNAPEARPVTDVEVVSRMGSTAREVPIAGEVVDYAARLVRATHPGDAGAPGAVAESVRFGASPRGLLAIVLGAKAMALIAERHHVSRTDVRAVLPPALRHRVILNYTARAEGVEVEELLGEVVRSVPE